jgi:hypothetical protein
VQPSASSSYSSQLRTFTAVAEISTIAVTGSLVWLFLGNQGSLAGGIRKYAAKSNKRSRQEDRKNKKTAGKAITEKAADTKNHRGSIK